MRYGEKSVCSKKDRKPVQRSALNLMPSLRLFLHLPVGFALN